ncbi:caspase family protein [Nitrospira sp. Kam-Ns4a]
MAPKKTLPRWRGVLACLLVPASLSRPVWAGEPPTEPVLQIESGMHTAIINRIGVDAANRVLVTGSDDKTARVWDLATGRLLQILWPPIGDGNEGKIYAVAISPDGRTVAAGGWTGYEWDGSNSIYLFDRATGHIVRRLAGLPNVILHLAYSPDSSRLVATLGGKNGIRVYRTADYALIGEDRDYGGQSYGADFDASGRLATCSDDGFVRLYDPSLRLLAKRRAPGGAEPFSVRFSPDGTKIAVGFDDSTHVNVLSAKDLGLLYAPDSEGVRSGNVSSVAWSADGRRLYAGGRYHLNGSYPIRVWAEAGRGQATDLPATKNTIMDLQPLADGGVVFGTADPGFVVFDARDRRTLFRGPTTADYRGEAVLVSHEGDAIQFDYGASGKAPTCFSLATRVPEAAGSGRAGLTEAVTVAPGLEITGWQHTGAPKLNGRPLPLKPYEISRSLAIAPDHQTFLLGADWSIRLFDRTGRELWQVSAPGFPRSVNIAGNGQVAVVALGDGTIRWYRLRDGKELLAFFPHNDRKRWVLWTPSGYYDAAPGAEELIGWRLNRGKDQAGDFFPVGQFRSTYYRPDVVAKVLETLDEGGAIRAANAESGRKGAAVPLTQQLPPVVTILAPAAGAAVAGAEVLVRIAIRSPSGEPVTVIKALVDGRPVMVERGVAVLGPATQRPGSGQAGSGPASAGPEQGEGVRELRVPIPERDAEIAILAENRFAVSEPALVRVRWRGRATGNEAVIKPKLYVLAIGISAYQREELRLGFAAKDARDFARAMARQQGGLYEAVETKVLTDGQATKENILDHLDWLLKQTTGKDVAMVFLAGHGDTDVKGKYYFLPVNVDPERLMATGVPYTDLKETVEALAGKVFAFVDTCKAGNVLGKRRGGADINQLVHELANADSGAVVFTAATGRQASLEHPDWGNGAFTKALVEGLNGQADLFGRGTITITSLEAYIAERVKALTKGKQTPTTAKPKTVPDFPVAVVR